MTDTSRDDFLHALVAERFRPTNRDRPVRTDTDTPEAIERRQTILNAAFEPLAPDNVIPLRRAA